MTTIFALDTSGSTFDLAHSYGVDYILANGNSNDRFVCFDTTVYGEQIVGSLDRKKIKGGGGTDITDLLKYVTANEKLVVISDGYFMDCGIEIPRGTTLIIFDTGDNKRVITDARKMGFSKIAVMDKNGLVASEKTPAPYYIAATILLLIDILAIIAYYYL